MVDIDICNGKGKHSWILQAVLVGKQFYDLELKVKLECENCGIKSFDRDFIEDFMNEHLQSDSLDQEQCTCQPIQTAEGIDEKNCPKCEEERKTDEIPY